MLDVVQFWVGDKPDHIKLCMKSVGRFYPQTKVYQFDMMEGETVAQASDRARFNYLANTPNPTLYFDCDVYLERPIDLPDNIAFSRWQGCDVDIWAIYTNGESEIFKKIYNDLSYTKFDIGKTHKYMQRFGVFPEIKARHVYCASKKGCIEYRYKKLLKLEEQWERRNS